MTSLINEPGQRRIPTTIDPDTALVAAHLVNGAVVLALAAADDASNDEIDGRVRRGVGVLLR